MKRIISMVLLAVLLVGLVCIAPSATANNASIRNRKIVSVVYDDSGSMDGEKWEYTSYAMQCFAAMLNKEDRLDITYMSSYQNGSFRVDTGNRAQSVQQIREHTDRSSKTPVAAVQTGFDTLNSVVDNNVNTQYWLIVMTDGKMTGAEEKVNELADKKMPNGTKPHIVYLTLCDVNNEYTPTFTKSNIENRSALTADGIIKVISDISGNIAGRFQADAGAIKQITENTLEITTDLPLFNMGILSQRSSAQIVSVVGKNGTQLQNEGNVAVKTPGKFPNALPAEAKAALNGNVALLSAPSGNIAAGTYTVTFSDSISAADVVAMFEPAFDLRLELTVDGTIITNPAQLQEGDLLQVTAVLYETGTDNKIAMGMLPSGRQNYISYSQGGQVIAQDDEYLRLSNLELAPVETEITAMMTIPGFFTVSDTIRFFPAPTALSGMTAELYYDGSERRMDENGQPDPNNVVYITELANNKTGIAFTLFIDEQPISKEEAELRKDAFASRLSIDFPNYDITITDDGRYIVYPTDTNMLDLFYYAAYQGSHTISCTYDGFTAGGDLVFKIGDSMAAHKEFLTIVFWILLIIYILLWLFAKPHFSRAGLICVYQANGNGSPYNTDVYAVRIHYLAACGPLNWLWLKGMRKHLKGTGLTVRASAGGGYRLEGVKDKRVSTGSKYPINVSVCVDNFYEFNDVVYVSLGNNKFYKITVT